MCLCCLFVAVIKIPWPGELIEDCFGAFTSKSIRGHPGVEAWLHEAGIAVEAGSCSMMHWRPGTERANWEQCEALNSQTLPPPKWGTSSRKKLLIPSQIMPLTEDQVFTFHRLGACLCGVGVGRGQGWGQSFFFFFPFFIRYLTHLHFQCYTKSPPYPPTPTPLPTHSPFLALVFPCTGAYKVCKSNGPLFPVMAD